MPSNLTAPEPFQTKRLKRKQFASTGDVHIQGDAIIETQLLVGGDLLVDGDLIAEEVFCLGKLTVTGEIRVQSLYVGQTLDGAGDISVEFMLKTGCTPVWMARMLELDVAETPKKIKAEKSAKAEKPAKAGKAGKSEKASKAAKIESVETSVALEPETAEVSVSYLDQLVHPAILQRDAHQEVFGGYGDIQGLGVLSCEVLDCHGNLQIDGMLQAGEVLYVGGHLAASEIQVSGDCNCKGEIFSETDITISGSLFAGATICQGNLDVAAICSQGDISSWGSIRADKEISSLNGEIHCGRWIATKETVFAAKYIKAGEAIVAEKGISCGEDYGILAATSLRRSLWPTQGFVSAASAPEHLLSGVFVAGKKRSHIDALEKKRTTELDWEIPRRLKREADQKA